MLEFAGKAARVFKTAWFSRKARKARIDDVELCKAIQEVMLGQAVDLGGGVFKKRLNENMHRGIILARGGRIWVYQYLFAKNDRENIDDGELAAFRELAKAYESLSGQQIERLLKDKDFLEICDGEEDQVQK